MKVVILIDNNPDREGKYLTEHGLSIYFEADGLKWLIDVGASPNFAINAKRFGISIKDIDYLVLSHAHKDHTGGLEYFLRKNKKGRVLMAPLNNQTLFISYRKNIFHDITVDKKVISAYIERFDFPEKERQLSKSVRLIRHIPLIYPVPKANRLLMKTNQNGNLHDNFDHESVLAVNTLNGVVVFSGCSHHGLLNIIQSVSQSFKGEKIGAIIGGTHLLDGDEYDRYETKEEVEALINEISHQHIGILPNQYCQI